MATTNVKFLGLTNPMLRDCIDKLINTTMALQNSLNVMFGNLANWQATVKPTLPPAPKTLQESVSCNTEDMAFNKYFKNAVNTLAEVSMNIQKIEAVVNNNTEAPKRDYDPTILLDKKTFVLNENV